MNSTTITLDEKEAQRKEKQNARAKRCYAKNKEAIREKAKITYAQTHGVMKLNDHNELIQAVRNAVNNTAGNEATNANIVNTIKSLSHIFQVDTIDKFKTFVTKKPADALIKIDEAVFGKDNTPYASNSKRFMLSFMLNILFLLNIELTNKTMKMYKNRIEILNERNTQRVNVRNEAEKDTLLSFTEFLNLIKNKFGEDSMEYMLMNMYNEIACRDDFGNLTLIDDKKKMRDLNKNYILIGKRDTKIILNQFKTHKDKEDDINVKLSKPLSIMIRNFIAKNNIAIGDELLPFNKMSKTITEINRSVGIDGGINILRRMRIKTENNDPISTEESKLKLAHIMGHSLHLQQNYYSGK